MRRQHVAIPRRIVLAILGIGLFSGCTLGPDYRRPDVAIPVQWQPDRRAGDAMSVGPSVVQRREAAIYADVDVAPGVDADRPPAWALAPWWQRLDDPLLDDLVTATLSRNRDIAIAAEKVVHARTAFGQASSSQWPSVSAKANGTRMKQPPAALAGQGINNNDPSQSGAGRTSGGAFSFVQMGLDASWELDLFGGNRRAAEAARYGLDAARWEHRATMLALVGDVVGYYTQARRAQHLHAIEQDNVRTLQGLLRLSRARYEAGTVSRLDSVRFDADLRTAQARVTGQAVHYVQAANALSTLTGDAPGTWLPALLGIDGQAGTPSTDPARARDSATAQTTGHIATRSNGASGMTSTSAAGKARPAQSARTLADTPLPFPMPSFPVVVDVPSSVLLMRPDLQVAERGYAAATARVGVARADRFPKISLVGNLFSVGMRAGDLATHSSIGWAIGPSLSIPLFTGGRLRAAVAMADSDRQQAFLRYEALVLSALREVEDAMTGLSGAVSEADAAAVAACRYAEAADLASARFVAGADTQDASLQAQRDHAAARVRLADSRAAVTLAYVALQKALGGAWDGLTAPKAGISPVGDAIDASPATASRGTISKTRPAA
jgi:outer membrane protein TolC